MFAVSVMSVVPNAPASTTPNYAQRNYTITGVTKDLNNNNLASCTVNLFYTVGNILAQTTTSDASGNYSFNVTSDPTVQFYCVSYKSGAPDVAGTTVNTLAGA